MNEREISGVSVRFVAVSGMDFCVFFNVVVGGGEYFLGYKIFSHL